MGPNRCSCKPGYVLKENRCEADCPKGELMFLKPQMVHIDFFQAVGMESVQLPILALAMPDGLWIEAEPSAILVALNLV